MLGQEKGRIQGNAKLWLQTGKEVPFIGQDRLRDERWVGTKSFLLDMLTLKCWWVGMRHSPVGMSHRLWDNRTLEVFVKGKVLKK